jgi:NADPH:quinone reductase-like Zn-dependent oxidoreductase
MKAVQIVAFGGPEHLRYGDVPTPEPGPGEVRIHVSRCGVNPVDRSQVLGRWPWLKLPHIPGSEIAGTVDALGSGVTGLHVGERVAVALRLFCNRCHYCLRGQEQLCMADPRTLTAPAIPGAFTEGGYAEYTIIPALNAIPVPVGLDEDLACVAALDGLTAWHMVDRARVSAGDHVLVVGASGGLGTLFLQLVARRGAVAHAVTGSMANAHALGEFGAATVIDRTTGDVSAAARDLTGGRGMDVVLDPTGAASWVSSLGALARGGRYATCGILTGAEVTLNLAPFYAQEHEIIGSTGGSRRDLEECMAAMARHELRVPIHARYPLAQAPDAMRALDDPARLGKVLLDVA